MQLPQATVIQNVRDALREDLGSGDIHACLADGDNETSATVITRSEGVFCGRPWVNETLRQIDPNTTIEWLVRDGTTLVKNQTLMRVQGKSSSLFASERTLLNFAQLLSGTATTTAHFVELTRHTNAKVLDTRKTIPGLRIAQKYAVSQGGGYNHRMGLFDAFLIKENHIRATGSISTAVRRARGFDPNLFLEVEVENELELDEAIQSGADRVLLDNFSIFELTKAVRKVDHKLETEASGGIDETSIVEVAETGVDYISIGLLTKDVKTLDFSLLFEINS